MTWEGGVVVEVSASSASYDLGAKMAVNQRTGVHEYVVWQILEERIDWFRRESGVCSEVAPCSGGIYESAVFPGLRLDAQAMLRGDLAAVLAALGPVPRIS